MTRSLGIDIRDAHVRIAVVRAAYRKLEVEALYEEPVSVHETPEQATEACMRRVAGGPVDVVTSTLQGKWGFVHRLALPVSAEKRLAELLPFELEGELPIEVDEVVFDYQVAPRPKGSKEPLSVLVAAARIEQVRERIAHLRQVTGHEPERIGGSALELGQLYRVVPALRSEAPVALVDFGYSSTDICILVSGAVAQARTLSVGIGGFPEGAEAATLQVRQTLAAFAAASGQAVTRLVLLGDGAEVDGMDVFLAARLGTEVEGLGTLEIEGLSERDLGRVPAYARAIASAVHGARGGGGFNFRQGELSFERGFGHIKERAPLILGLVGAIAVSFLFATWAEGQALVQEHVALTESLEKITQDTFGVPTGDPEEAAVELGKARKVKPEDPMPYLDGFGAAVVIADIMPEGIKHDIEEFDYAKGKLKIRGVVDSTEEAQEVNKAFGEHRCVPDSKITKITQVVNSERERYVLEATILCPEDEGASEKKTTKSGASE